MTELSLVFKKFWENKCKTNDLTKIPKSFPAQLLFPRKIQLKVSIYSDSFIWACEAFLSFICQLPPLKSKALPGDKAVVPLYYTLVIPNSPPAAEDLSDLSSVEAALCCSSHTLLKAISFWWDMSLSEHHPCCAKEAGVCRGAQNSSETGERTGLFSARPAQEPDVHSGEFGMESRGGVCYRCNKKYVQLPARPVHWPISWGAHLKPTFRCLHLRSSMDRSVQRRTFSGNPCALLNFLVARFLF